MTNGTPPTGDSGDPTEVRIRRAPKLSVFLILGALAGMLATLILTSLFPADPSVGFAATFGYFLLYGVPAGLVLCAAVGLVLDRISLRRMRTVTVEREVVEAPPRPPTQPDADEPDDAAGPDEAADVDQ
ncbi:hypothetical protein BH11ACT3_BH11ACT3_11920 [soil metagenome]